MTDREATCLSDGTVVELALGELAGRGRADALAHALDCVVCRERLQALIDTGDRLLLAAPESEPPPGFESAVLDRLLVAPEPARHHRLRAVAVVAVAALVIVVAGIAGVGLTHGPRAEVDETAMVTPSGRDVGQAWRYKGTPGWVFVSVPGWRTWIDQAGTPPRDYRLRARLDDGTTVELGALALAPDTGSWGITTPFDARRIRSLAIVDASGRAWCRGTF